MRENKLLKNKLKQFMSEQEIENYLEEESTNNNEHLIYREEHWKSSKNKTNGEKIEDSSGFIYIIYEEVKETYKIGKAKHVRDRLDHFNVKLPFDFEIIYEIPVSDRHKAEKILHNKFEESNVDGEWFDISKKEIRTIFNNSDFKVLIDNGWLRQRDEG